MAWNSRRLRGATSIGTLLEEVDFTKIAKRHIAGSGRTPQNVSRYLRTIVTGLCYGCIRFCDTARLLRDETVCEDAEITHVPSKNSLCVLVKKVGKENWGACLSETKAKLEELVDIASIPDWFKQEFKNGFRYRAANEGNEKYGFDVLMRFLHRNGTIDDLLECMGEKKSGKIMAFTLQMILGVYFLHHKRFYGMRSHKNDRCLSELRGRYGEVSLRTLYDENHRFDPDKLMQLYYRKVKEIYSSGRDKSPLWIAIDSSQLPIYGTSYTDENGDYPKLVKTHSAGTQRAYTHAFNLFVAFDIERKIPICFSLSGQNLGDPFTMMQLLAKIKDLTNREIRFLCIDRGFQNYENFDRLDRSKISFITLADKNADDRLVKREANEAWRLQNGEMMEMDPFYLPGKTCKVRRIILRKDMDHNGEMKKAFIQYITNNLEETPWRIIRRYRKRANIENFFKELKDQGWNINSFPGWKWDRVINHVLMIMILFLEVSKFKSMLPDEVLRKAELKTLCDSFLKQKVTERLYEKHRQCILGEWSEGDSDRITENIVGGSVI